VPNFTDFFSKFVSRLPMKTELKAEIANNGLACLNVTSQIISQSFHQDLTVSSVRELLEKVQLVEEKTLPRCLQTYNQIMSFFEENANLSQINTPAKAEMFKAKLIQIGARVFIELYQNQTLDAAQDLTLFLETAFGLIHVYLPPTLEFNPARGVPFSREKATPLFLKGFFTALGVQNQAKINGTIQCIQDISHNTELLLNQLTSKREDFFTQVNLLLDNAMLITDAFERCDKLEKINLDAVKSLIETVKSHPGESFLKMAGSAIMQLPTIKQSEINMKVYLKQGEYELVGQQFALNLLRVYQGLLL